MTVTITTLCPTVSGTWENTLFGGQAVTRGATGKDDSGLVKTGCQSHSTERSITRNNISMQ